MIYKIYLILLGLVVLFCLFKLIELSVPHKYRIVLLDTGQYKIQNGRWTYWHTYSDKYPSLEAAERGVEEWIAWDKRYKPKIVEIIKSNKED